MVSQTTLLLTKGLIKKVQQWTHIQRTHYHYHGALPQEAAGMKYSRVPTEDSIIWLAKGVAVFQGMAYALN